MLPLMLLLCGKKDWWVLMLARNAYVNRDLCFENYLVSVYATFWICVTLLFTALLSHCSKSSPRWLVWCCIVFASQCLIQQNYKASQSVYMKLYVCVWKREWICTLHANWTGNGSTYAITHAQTLAHIHIDERDGSLCNWFSGFGVAYCGRSNTSSPSMW